MSEQHPRGRLRRVGVMWKPKPGGVSKALGTGSLTVNGLRQRFAMFVNAHKTAGSNEPDYVLLSSDEPEVDEYAQRAAAQLSRAPEAATRQPDGFVDPVGAVASDDIPF